MPDSPAAQRRRMAALLIAAAALAGGVSGCFGGDDRDDLSGYLSEANEIQASSTDLQNATQVFARFAAGEIKPRDAAERVASSEAAIAGVREQLAGLDPPTVGERLHELLLRVYDLNAKLAAETAQFAEFVPQSDRVARELDPVNARMRQGLAGAPPPGQQAKVLSEYAAAIEEISGELAKLEPPPILKRAHGERLKRLREIQRVSERLAGALRGGDTASLQALLTQFQQATASGPGSGIDPKSLREYRERYREIRKAAVAVRREERRVRRELE